MSEKDDLEFLKRIREKIDNGDIGYALEMIDDWIGELEKKVGEQDDSKQEKS